MFGSSRHLQCLSPVVVGLPMDLYYSSSGCGGLHSHKLFYCYYVTTTLLVMSHVKSVFSDDLRQPL